jgi:hypothetical protein
MSDGKMFVIVFRGRQTGLPCFENSRNVEMTTVRLPRDLTGLGEGLLVLYGDLGVGVCFWNREGLLLE